LITEFKGTNNAALVTQLDAIRGIDVPNTDLVVITKPFDSLDDYIHAAGITGRTKGGVDGNCRVVSIALPSERSMLRTNDFNFALV
jgi:superfamily II DNA/RNA helicase